MSSGPHGPIFICFRFQDFKSTAGGKYNQDLNDIELVAGNLHFDHCKQMHKIICTLSAVLSYFSVIIKDVLNDIHADNLVLKPKGLN